jgi:hypothetical protein
MPKVVLRSIHPRTLAVDHTGGHDISSPQGSVSLGLSISAARVHPPGGGLPPGLFVPRKLRILHANSGWIFPPLTAVLQLCNRYVALLNRYCVYESDRPQNHPFYINHPRPAAGSDAYLAGADRHGAVLVRCFPLAGGPILGGGGSHHALVRLGLHRARKGHSFAHRPAEGTGGQRVVPHHPQPDLCGRGYSPIGICVLVPHAGHPADAGHRGGQLTSVCHLLRGTAPAQDIRCGL